MRFVILIPGPKRQGRGCCSRLKRAFATLLVLYLMKTFKTYDTGVFCNDMVFMTSFVNQVN